MEHSPTQVAIDSCPAPPWLFPVHVLALLQPTDDASGKESRRGRRRLTDLFPPVSDETVAAVTDAMIDLTGGPDRSPFASPDLDLSEACRVYAAVSTDIPTPLAAGIAAKRSVLRNAIGRWRGFPFDGFDLEFHYLERMTDVRTKEAGLTFEAAGKPENLPRNRYINVIPPDHSRVLLSDVDGASDYVNANYVGSCYISTQGPLEETIADFWRMVWEQRSRKVFMLTREVEMGVLKCSEYYAPVRRGGDEESDMSDDQQTPYELKLVSEVVSDEYTERVLKLRWLGAGDGDGVKWRTIHQYQYTGWPDHGIPASTDGFLYLVDQFPPKGRGIVHCSAGIGRSGTFIIVHKLLNLPASRPINVVEEILRARLERPGVVQTREQFEFIYEAVMKRRKDEEEAAGGDEAAGRAEPTSPKKPRKGKGTGSGKKKKGSGKRSKRK